MAALAFPSPPLTDGVVLLRPWCERDVPAQLAAWRDPHFLVHSDWAPASEAAARRALVDSEQARQRGERVMFALAEPHDHDVVLGGCSLDERNGEQGTAAIGYWATPQGRGRGVVTHSVRLLARWAFADLGLARLQLTCGPDNHPSQRVAERCGFTREGLLRSHVPFKGGRRDTVVFGLLPGELMR